MTSLPMLTAPSQSKEKKLYEGTTQDMIFERRGASATRVDAVFVLSCNPLKPKLVF